MPNKSRRGGSSSHICTRCGEGDWYDRVEEKGGILLIDGDPLADITMLKDKEKIVVVMKEGQIEVDRR